MKIGCFCNPWSIGCKIMWRPPVEALRERCRPYRESTGRRDRTRRRRGRERCRPYRESTGSAGIDLPCVPLFFAIECGAIRNNVHGFGWIPDRIPRFRELWKSNRRPRRAR